MFTLPDNVKVLNLPEQVEKNREDIDKQGTLLTNRNSEIDYLKHRADDLEKNTGSADGAIITGTIDAEKKATFGSDVEVDGTLAVNSFGNITEKTSDGTQTLQSVIDAKQDKLTTSLPSTTSYTLDTLCFDDDGNLQRGTIDKVAPITWDEKSLTLDAISIGYNNYRLVPIGDTNDMPDTLAIGYRSRVTATKSACIGDHSVVKGEESVAVGEYAQANDASAAAVGYNARVGAEGAIALGSNSKAFIDRTLSIDSDNNDEAPRTLLLRSTDNLFFLNDSPDASKTSVGDYTKGKTLSDYLKTAGGATQYYQHTILIAGGTPGISPLTKFAFTAISSSSDVITNWAKLCDAFHGKSFAASGIAGQDEEGAFMAVMVNIGATEAESTISRAIKGSQLEDASLTKLGTIYVQSDKVSPIE